MARRLRILLMLVLCLGVVLALAAPAMAKRPTHFVIVVIDQMQPGYAQQFGMTNVLDLQKKGVNFPNAYVGHMASETVIAHNVMVSGQFPKHMGWSDEAFRDVNNVIGYGADAIVTSGDLGFADYEKLIAEWDYKKLGDYLHEKFPGTVVANVGQKGYQVESMAASSSDYYVRYGSKKKTSDLADPSVVPWSGTYRGPSGKLPDYIKNDNRFLVSVGNPSDSLETTKTAPAWMYAEDGRYVVGDYAGHEGGDNWVADASLKIMDNENWSGLWVTFSSMDKVGHMWGTGEIDTLATYGWDPNSIFAQIHMPWVAKNADNQLGRLLAKLKEKGIDDETLIVVTADHGATYGKGEGFKGVEAYDAGVASNWYAGSWYPGYGSDPKVPNTSAGSPNLKPLMDIGNVAFSYQSTAIETWLKDWSMAKKLAAADVMEDLPGVIATYVKNGDRYKRYSADVGMTKSESDWWAAHGQELVDTMCYEGSGDVVGLLADYTSYGVFGDHGGAQMDVQRIPMVWYMPGIKRAVNKSGIRLVDLMPTAMKAIGIAATDPMDGKAYDLKIK